MHGELMEFNSHLQCRLQAADLLLQRFRNELVHLRGSLSSDYIRNEDGSNVNNESIMDYPLIHIWIPSTFLVHEQGHSHHVYQVSTSIQSELFLFSLLFNHFELTRFYFYY